MEDDWRSCSFKTVSRETERKKNRRKERKKKQAWWDGTEYRNIQWDGTGIGRRETWPNGTLLAQTQTNFLRYSEAVIQTYIFGNIF